ncbi:MAG: aspartate kinase [Candidatus Fimenecus sp.]
MALIVQKFGGSSVKDKDSLMRVAEIIKDTKLAGNDVAVVVSAQGDTTDILIEKAHEISKAPSKRELDQLMASGEQISISLLAMALEKLGVHAISLLGWQAGFSTSSAYGAARIRNIKPDRMRAELDKGNVIIIAGFQGINKYEDLTTLGRGGSDTSAVAIAAALRADRCQIFTDVEGVYTADPRKIQNAKKLKEITYDEMLELATLGAQVLNNRSVEMAKKFNVELEVLSSIIKTDGTIVKEVAKMEKMLIRGVTKDNAVTRISVTGVPNSPGIAYKLFSKLAYKKVNVDVILQSVGRNDTKDISFTVSSDNTDLAIDAVNETFDLSNEQLKIDTDVAKVSVVGAGMESHPGTAATMFRALYESGVNIDMISTSEIKISVLIKKDEADRAVAAVHRAFFPENPQYQ